MRIIEEGLSFEPHLEVRAGSASFLSESLLLVIEKKAVKLASAGWV